MNTIESICPSFVGERKIALTPADPTLPPQLGVPYLLAVDFAQADALGGVRLPLVVSIGAPSPADSSMQAVRSVLPGTITITPQERGRHTVSIREMFGHHFWGGLTVEVE